MSPPVALLAAASFTTAVALASDGLPAAGPGSSGSALRHDLAVEAGLLVRRGGWAVLSTAQGGIAIESRVEVLQDGKAGQRILVRGSAWPQPIAARVVGAGRVEPAR